MSENHGILDKLPTTKLTWVFAWLLIGGTACNYFVREVVPDTGWLVFLAAAAGISSGAVVGMRAATKANVILAEAAVEKSEANGTKDMTDKTLASLESRPPEAKEKVSLDDLP